MFKCPWCGSEAWGTDSLRNMGTCHGWKKLAPRKDETGISYRHCDFEWPRTDEEDAKVGIENIPEEPVIGQIQELKRANLHIVK